jgi:hypothetical protein
VLSLFLSKTKTNTMAESPNSGMLGRLVFQAVDAAQSLKVKSEARAIARVERPPPRTTTPPEPPLRAL